jgi:hypothetical protein
MKKPNVLYVLIILMILVFTRAAYLLYYNLTESQAGGTLGVGFLMNLSILFIVFYLLHDFKFSNPLLVIILYLLLIKPVIAIFSYLEKNYHLFNLKPETSAKLHEMEYYGSNASYFVSIIMSFYILYYIFFNK